MRKNYCYFSAFLISFIFISSHFSIAQTKKAKPVIQPNFVSPFSKKQKTGNTNQQVNSPNGAAKPKARENQNYSFQKEVYYSTIKFTSKSDVVSRDFFRAFGQQLNISSSDSFKLIKTEHDEIGFTHYRYQQIFKGFTVMGGEYLLHEKNGKLVSVNGNFYDGLAVDIAPTINEETAIQKALKYVGAEKYLWENIEEENFLKKESNDPKATHYPKAELLIAPKDGIFTVDNFRLSYKINVASEKLYDFVDIYVDAHTGEVINRISKIAHADVPATGNTLYSGSKSITTDSYLGSYRLRESGRPIQTFNMRNSGNYSAAVDFTNSTTTWITPETVLNSVTISTINTFWEDFFEQTSSGEAPDIYIQIVDASSNVIWSKANRYFENTFPPITINTQGLNLSNGPYTLNIYDYDASSSDDLLGSFTFSSVAGTNTFSGSGTAGSISKASRNNAALDVHWAMEKVYDFYLTQLSRNSYNNLGGLIKNYVHTGIGYNNASWNGTYNVMNYGDGDGVNCLPFVSIDVTGHEFTHGVVQYTAGLIYQGESGALNESFADIMGTAIEFYASSSPDWLCGEDFILTPPYYGRSMSNPNACSDPDTYNGSYWADPSNIYNDHGGVHINSGVQNFWFYLLSQGGSGTNDISHSYSVTGIGINSATRIAYRNLAYYLGTNSNYMNSYYGSLQAAEDLFGSTSAQVSAVRAAWYAVGIGSNTQCSSTITDANTFRNLSGSFSDGSGSSNYQNNLDCFWLIEPTGANSISLNFTSFSTEANYDTVIVYDGPTTSAPVLMRWWGSTLPPALTSTAGALLVRFRTDNSITNSGWTANYTSSGTAYCNGGTLLANPSGSFSDGSGTSNYGNNQLCYWLIAPPCAGSVTLSFSAFNTETGYDGIMVYNGNSTSAPIILNTSGTTIPSPVTASSGEMLVVFVSDYSNRMQGFSASYTSTGSPYCSGTTIFNTTDWGNLSDGSGTSNYCNNIDCRYLIQPPQATSVTFNFTNFDVEPISTDGYTIYDAVEIYDGTSTSAPLLGRFAGNSLPPSVTSTGGSMYLRFFSDISVTKPGWSGYYTSTTTNYCSGTTTLTASSGSFTDGSGAYKYGNGQDCKWLIQPPGATSVSLSFTAFETELDYDGVIIYNGSTTSSPQLGSYTGNTLPPLITSTGGAMLVRFISDESERRNGWAANYSSAIPCAVPTSINVTGVTSSSATLSWPTVAGAINYTVEYRQLGATPWTTVTSTGASYNIVGLTANTAYQYHVRTNCSGSSSSYSGIGTFTTFTLPCSVPTSINVTNITSTTAMVNWAIVSNAISYNIQYRPSGASTWTTATATTNSFVISGLSPGTIYEYTLQSVCSGTSASSISTVSYFTTLCPVPTGLVGSDLTATSISLTWSVVPGAASYMIRYRQVGEPTWINENSVINSITISGLLPGSSYEFQVQTVCSGSFTMSVLSSSDIFTTICPMPTVLTTSDITFTTVKLNWADVANDLGYNIRYRQVGTTTWNDLLTTVNTSVVIVGLVPTTKFEYQVQTICPDSTLSEYADSTFTTISANPEIYPNPSKGIFTLELNDILNANMAVYNTVGKIIFETPIIDNTTTIDLRELSSGIYFVRINSAQYNGIKKVVLNR